jgi:pimeloyl-ACP methyl ester carboxylesterase
MARAQANGIELEYETAGLPAGRPLLLIMGLGGQLLHWEEGFVARLVAEGHFAIRFDNRDAGLSSRFEGTPDLPALMAAKLAGQEPPTGYTLRDMADDAAGLLDALGIPVAHVVGMSMGGMIAQELAIRYPARVKSLTSIMSTTGNPELPPAKPEAAARLVRAPVNSREEAVAAVIETFAVIAGSLSEIDLSAVRATAARAYDRAYFPAGLQRQLAAILAAGSRVDALNQLSVPSLVVHGLEDPLIPVEAGIDTQGALRGSELLLLEGVGHYLPRSTWPEIVGAISKLTRSAD